MIFRALIKHAKDNPYDIEEDKKIIKFQKKYKPFESLTSFSAIQELGLWLPFEKIQMKEDYIKIYDTIGYFNHLLRNFICMFKKENIILCINCFFIHKNILFYKRKNTYYLIVNVFF